MGLCRAIQDCTKSRAGVFTAGVLFAVIVVCVLQVTTLLPMSGEGYRRAMILYDESEDAIDKQSTVESHPYLNIKTDNVVVKSPPKLHFNSSRRPQSKRKATTVTRIASELPEEPSSKQEAITKAATRGSVQKQDVIESAETKKPVTKQLQVKKPIKVLYKDLSSCRKPEYLPEYKAHCWGVCALGMECPANATYRDIKAGRAKLRCIPNVYLIGIRKCGSTDIRFWFNARTDVLLAPADFYPDMTDCPGDMILNNFTFFEPVEKPTYTYFQYGPGNAFISTINWQNSTHMEVTNTMQMLASITTPKTKFLLQLRQPTDRVISYYFHWNKVNLTFFKHKTLADLTEDFTHNVLMDLLGSLKECIANLGELACFYQTDGKPGNMDGLIKHSMYVVFLEEILKFIPREQILITSFNHEYVVDERKTIMKISNFYDVEFKVPEVNGKDVVRNAGKKNPVKNETIAALDEFFEPYNRRLAALLKDDRFLFDRADL